MSADLNSDWGTIESDEPIAPVTVPWLDGALLHYLTSGSLLDIKAEYCLDLGPVTVNAKVISMADFEPTGRDKKFERRRKQVWSDLSFDAVFSKDALVAARDPVAMLANWFHILRPGCYMVLVLPLATDDVDKTAADFDLGVPTAEIFSSAQPRQGGSRAITAQALVRIVHNALPPAGFEIVELYKSVGRRRVEMIDPEPTEIRLVLRKSQPMIDAKSAELLTPDSSDSDLLALRTAPTVADVAISFMHIRPHPLKAPGMRADCGLLIRDFAPQSPSAKRILVLKLDHHGDFVIGLPALRELRQNYPQSYIRLICGSWNVVSARACGLVDDVRVFDYFPERAAEWTGSQARATWAPFAAAADGFFDIAIDMRVDEDTRPLLGRVDAGLRCGIGSIARFPMLDVALPDGSREPLISYDYEDFLTSPEGLQVLKPEAFESNMEIQTPIHHETRLSDPTSILLSSGEYFLAKGDYSAEFDVTAFGFVPGINPMSATIEVIADGSHQISSKIFGRRNIAKLTGGSVTLRFQTTGKPSFVAFRLRIEGKALRGRLRFSGIHLRRLDANGARYSPSELHVGEKLCLLVALIRARASELMPPAIQLAAPRTDGRLMFAIAPFSNSTIRDWPVSYFVELIELLVEKFDCTVTLLGAKGQAQQADILMGAVEENLIAEGKVVNQVGKTSWSELPEILQSSDLVICNNSGIAHQAALLDARTLAIYSASHQPMEWGPRGRNARAIMASVACSPCGYERIEHCVNDHLCMRLITPEKVLSQVEHLLA